MWAGQIKRAGFKGEATYFHPYKTNGQDPKIVADLSFDYTFPSTLAFRIEGLFNSNPKQDFLQVSILDTVTTKNLTFNKWSVFGSVAHDITPLTVFNLNGIYYADDKSFFVNPNLTFSLDKNTDFLIASQIFGGSKSGQFGNLGSYLFTRLKWSS